MIARRKFLVGAAASLMCAPAVVRASSLMPVRSFTPHVELPHCGFAQRVYVQGHIPKIVALRNSGLSVTEIAAALNLQGTRAMNGIPCDIGFVQGVIGLEREIRRTDAMLRADRRKAV
jgi:hypothetical protein